MISVGSCGALQKATSEMFVALGLEVFYIDFFFSLRYMNLARVHHLFYSVKSILK